MNTKHADGRMQQRAIPPLIINWLFEYGREEHDHRGAVIHYFDKRSIKKLQRDHGRRPIDRLTQYLDAYLVESDGTVLTVGHRFKRFYRT